MQTARIADFDVTRLSLGCWVFGGNQWGGQDDAESLATLRAALEAGVTHFDTATAYGRGRSEQVVGEVLSDRPAGVTLASKVSAYAHADGMVEAVDASRERLGVDVIDLYYIHWPQSDVDMRPAMEGLERCRAAGTLRAVGVSNFSIEQMDQVREVGTIDAHQFCYNMYWRFPERDIIPYCREHGIAGVTYSTIAQGILTGKFGREPQFAEGDQRPKTVLFDPAVYPHLWEATQRIKPLAERTGRSVVELALRWALAQPGCDVLLVGARRPAQLADNLKAAEGDLDAATLAELQAISDEGFSHVPDAGNIFRHYP